MKRLLWLTVLVTTVILALALTGPSTHALPEYSTQTGEPCASCHISPSGGGLRTPRGQAWVGAGKPGTVPDLTAALESLGVHITIDAGAYTTVPESIPPAQPVRLGPGQARSLHDWLKDYEGN